MGDSFNSLSNAPACASAGWLPTGAFPELDELRAEHLRLLGLLESTKADYCAVREEFEQKDAERTAAVAAQVADERVTVPPVIADEERRAKLAPISARYVAIQRALAELCERVLLVAEEMEASWIDALEDREDVMRDEIRRALDAFTAKLEKMREQRALRNWILRTAGRRHRTARARAIEFADFANQGPALTLDEAMAQPRDAAKPRWVQAVEPMDDETTESETETVTA